ncbi:MAG: CRTAC1 family protein [Chloroflexi bacterium]|nr:CRTAC1 family protein [Chloroflexota bacterium]
MFSNQSALLLHNPRQLNYGLAVTDVDGDGAFELIVAGFGYPNLVLKWNGAGFVNIATEALADPNRQAIGVAAADIDDDGREEIYILNTDSFGGQKRLADRLFVFSDDDWLDLFSVSSNRAAINLTAGRSVAAVDRDGDGRYGFFVANYGGPMRLYELNEDGEIADVAHQAGLSLVTGGRSLVALPLASERMDIFAGNENGPNFLFVNRGNGKYEEAARAYGLDDAFEHARGVAVLDADGDGRFDLVCGNWEGPHRLFVQTSNASDGHFREVAPPALAEPSRVRTVLAADFDNDGYEEIFFNNIDESNRLFGLREGHWTKLRIGDALEPEGLGTGAAVGDFDGDGRLELFVAHGESAPQPLTLYHTPKNGHHWLRVLPLTEQGAPARGAVVTVLAGGRTQRRAIDAGSGYLCQMEPVAHFGLGKASDIEQVEVRWLDGKIVTLNAPQADQLLRVSHPNRLDADSKRRNKHGFSF